jgi:hypothetical protein
MPRNSLLAHGVTRNSPKNEDMRKMTYSRGVHFGRFPPSAPQAAKNVTWQKGAFPHAPPGSYSMYYWGIVTSMGMIHRVYIFGD